MQAGAKNCNPTGPGAVGSFARPYMRVGGSIWCKAELDPQPPFRSRRSQARGLDLPNRGVSRLDQDGQLEERIPVGACLNLSELTRGLDPHQDSAWRRPLRMYHMAGVIRGWKTYVGPSQGGLLLGPPSLRG